MSAAAPPVPILLDHIADVLTRAGLRAAVVGSEGVVSHVAVASTGGFYRCVPVSAGIAVWFVPEVGDPVRVAEPATPARVAGSILDHQSGLL